MRIIKLLSIMLSYAALMISFTANAAKVANEASYQFGTNEVVGSSTLLRSPSGVSFSFESYGPADGSALNGHMTTIWLVVFNKPEHCTPEGGDNIHPACSLDDVMNAMSGGINAPEIDVLYGTGNIIGNGANAHFAGYRKVNDLNRSTFGIGLTDIDNAEIHLVLRSHGPLTSGYGENMGNVAESIGSFIGGCGGIPWFTDLGVIPTEEGQCNDLFYSVHKAN